MTKKSYSDGTAAVTYTYDSPCLKGYLCTVSNGSSSTNYGYSVLGQTIWSTQTTDGIPYSFLYTNNLRGDRKSVQYPSGRVVSYSLNGRGNPVTAGAYASGATYAPHGGMTGWTLGNGLAETVTWDAALRRASVRAVKGGLDETIANTYALNGNVKTQQVTFGTANYTQTYGYDGVNRLTGVNETNTGTATWNQTYQYDRWGNMAVTGSSLPVGLATVTALAQYKTPTNQTTNQIQLKQDGTAMPTDAYNGAGELEKHPLMGQFAYDAEGRLTSASVGSTSTTYVYDGEGRRVKRTIGSTAVRFVYDAAGQLMAETGVTGAPQTRYVTADGLGSTRLVTDGAVAVTSRHDYAPFGDELTSVTNGLRTPANGFWGQEAGVRQEFTGKERDTETGLDYFGARYMSSTQGRWTSPDAINITDERVLNPSNTLNKYVYGGNNPLKYKDPDGRDITVFYTETGNAGHFWMAAYNQANGQSAIMSFGPANGASQTQMALGGDVPGNTNYASHITSVNEVRRDYASLTIQTNPEETQKAISAINSTNAAQPAYNVYGSNCTTVCRDVFQKILGLNTNSIRPTALWSDLFLRWSKQAQQPRQTTSRGSAAPQVQSTHGVDYGNPRYGMNTFDFVWSLLQQQGQQQQQKEKVTSRICFTDENGKQVCQ